VNRVGVVARREFLATVRRRSYLVVTFGMPLFATLYFGLFALVPAYVMSHGPSAKPIGVVDEAAVTRPGEARPATRTRFLFLPSRAEALRVLHVGTIERFYVVPRDYLGTGAVETYQSDESVLGLERSGGREALERLLSLSLLAGRVPDEVRARVERPVDPARDVSFVVRPDGRVERIDVARRLARLAIPGVFAMLLLMSLMTSGGYLLHGVSEEKESRVIEVILSSVRPRELLAGKLLGLGAAGLVQLAVWVAVAGFAASLAAAAVLVYLDAGLFLACLVFFVLGFLMIGSLMTGTGALGTSARESQQFAAIWSVLTVVPPAVTWTLILDQPNGAVARALGWFPLSAPLTMMLRIGTGKVPLWDTLLSIACLAAGVYLALRAAAALLRLGLLSYGRRPPLRAILRQLRRA
jgi:ABC-2 type transport system permease protein